MIDKMSPLCHLYKQVITALLVVATCFSCSVETRIAIRLSERMIDWSNAGVWVDGIKGIPNYPVGVTAAPPAYAVDPTGTSDSQGGIQAAINACPAGSAVYLPAGTYQVGGRINLRTGVSLRGEGPGVTTIVLTASGAGFYADTPRPGGLGAMLMDPGPGPDANNRSGPIASGYSKGSTTVVVSSALSANLNPGNTVLINQLNDPGFVTHNGYAGDCTWAGGSGLRALGEVKMVASKSGTSITFTRPLYHEYKSSLEPKLIILSGADPTRHSTGVEDLTIDGNAVASRCVEFSVAANCWVKTVEFKNWVSYAVSLTWSALGIEVTNCYFHDAAYFGGSGGYGVRIVGNSTDNYIYNNIYKWVHVGVAIGSSGGTANVVAYNYVHSTNHYQSSWPIPGFGTHGAHTLMNLFEGNIDGRIVLDGYWGTGSHATVFRNWFTGDNNNPSVTMNKIAVEVERLNQYSSLIGNVLGFNGMTGGYEIGVDGVFDTGIGDFFIWKIGFPGASQDMSRRHQSTIDTLIRHGNHDYITNSTRWDPNISDRSIPASYYLSSKPAWFGSLDWPAIGPDVAGYVINTPSKLRWDTYISSGNLSNLFSN